MAALQTLLHDFTHAEHPVVMLNDKQVLAQAIAAVRFYAGYARIHSLMGTDALAHINGDTDISAAEWALIRPLFLLYIERESAWHLEASRTMGVEVFGRTSSEIAGDIARTEADLAQWAFMQPIITV